jgi:hypothetical protein
MAGTIPLINHVPDNAPIISNIIIADVVELILLLMLEIISVHFVPKYTLTIVATAAARSRASWLGPDNELSP